QTRPADRPVSLVREQKALAKGNRAHAEERLQARSRSPDQQRHQLCYGRIRTGPVGGERVPRLTSRLRKNRGQTAHFARPFSENQRLTLRNGCQTPVFPQRATLLHVNGRATEQHHGRELQPNTLTLPHSVWYGATNREWMPESWRCRYPSIEA